MGASQYFSKQLCLFHSAKGPFPIRLPAKHTSCHSLSLHLSLGYLYAGLEFGAECYCGHKIQAINVSDSDCNMECKGEKNNICGGVNRLSIYRLELAQESARRCKS
ncbi:UNVERIFIED_CONTAM: hypothetical protein K2H54_004245 [Gekko kuhli]